MLNTSTGIWTGIAYGNTARFNSCKKNELFISKKDREILYGLGSKIILLSESPDEKQKRDRWYDLNSLKFDRPLIYCDPENGWNEIITENMLECRGKLARKWEWVLRREIFYGEKLLDDKVIEPYFDISYSYTDDDWGIALKNYQGIREGGGGSVHFEPVVKDTGDLKKIHFPELVIDCKTTEDTIDVAKKVFRDTLGVRLKGKWWDTFGLTIQLVFLRGPQNIMLDMIDDPDLIHGLMKIISNGFQNRIDFLEEKNLLSLNNDGSYIGSGGFGYCRELPQKDFDNKVRAIDMWGFAESQETGYISPKMFEEFVFKYQLPLLNRFGLNCYGCCEALDTRWKVIKNIPGLRRVSVSPWANLEKMAENLSDKYIFSLKPSPNDLAVKNMDEDIVRKKTRKALEITKGCVLEIIMKDNHTLGGNPENLINWVRIARKEIKKVYG